MLRGCPQPPKEPRPCPACERPMELDGSDLCEACLTGIYQELPTFWSQLSVHL
jgi:hypothetical protein